MLRSPAHLIGHGPGAGGGGVVGLHSHASSPPHARPSLFDSCHRKIRLIGGGPVAFLGGLVASIQRQLMPPMRKNVSPCNPLSVKGGSIHFPARFAPATTSGRSQHWSISDHQNNARVTSIARQLLVKLTNRVSVSTLRKLQAAQQAPAYPRKKELEDMLGWDLQLRYRSMCFSQACVYGRMCCSSDMRGSYLISRPPIPLSDVYQARVVPGACDHDQQPVPRVLR
uniref:Uncharacterized protein n=1 Tax=Anopheles farauti TaxID=69004 RepID=A0A182Q6L6_9DIPT